jgi:hypothetical protein
MVQGRAVTSYWDRSSQKTLMPRKMCSLEGRIARIIGIRSLGVMDIYTTASSIRPLPWNCDLFALVVRRSG